MLISGCSRNEDQVQFEREAFITPEGFTEANSLREIVGPEDPDDWRISPMFQGFLEVKVPAHPNPTQGDFVHIELLIYGIESINGLMVESVNERNEFQQLYFHGRGTLEPGILTISFDPIRFSPSRVYSDARGLNRVLIYDQNDNLITYGDVMVE
ncbi:MAG: hypothetical protein WD491_08440 [Balneolales bacterium]